MDWRSKPTVQSLAREKVHWQVKLASALRLQYNVLCNALKLLQVLDMLLLLLATS